MKRVTRMKTEYRQTSWGDERVKVPYEKSVFDEEDKMRIVSEYSGSGIL